MKLDVSQGSSLRSLLSLVSRPSRGTGPKKRASAIVSFSVYALRRSAVNQSPVFYQFTSKPTNQLTDRSPVSAIFHGVKNNSNAIYEPCFVVTYLQGTRYYGPPPIPTVLGVHTNWPRACGIAESPCDPLSKCFRRFVTSTNGFDCYRLEQQLPGSPDIAGSC